MRRAVPGSWSTTGCWRSLWLAANAWAAACAADAEHKLIRSRGKFVQNDDVERKMYQRFFKPLQFCYDLRVPSQHSRTLL